MQKGRVFVGLSGGVDSAVSAALLKREGYDVAGVFIRIAIEGYPCPATLDRVEAMRVAAHLDIPFREIDLSKEYQERVFDYMLREYARGRTPNPDTLCNREIKFGLFYDYAMREGADFIATGHYARVQKITESSFHLLKGIDDSKDQSYFLWMVPEAHLAKTIFPVGDKKKSEVRALGKRFDLPNAARHDSQGLCFLGDISLGDMLNRELHPHKGNVLSEQGKVIGRHGGVMLYTLGQRHGFEINTHTPGTKAHYIVAKDTLHNTLTVSENKFPLNKHATELAMVDTNWIGEVQSGEYEVSFRYHQAPLAATLELSNDAAHVLVHTPQYAAEGQSLVLYRGERCLGGGIIDASELR